VAAAGEPLASSSQSASSQSAPVTSAPVQAARLPRAPRWRNGYDRGEVDEFLHRIDTRIVASAAGLGEAPTALEIRRTGFTLVRGGYDVAAVDHALDRLEVRVIELERQGTPPVDVPDLAEVLRSVLRRCPSQLFARVGAMQRGYDADEVDDFCHWLARHTDGPAAPPPRVEDVRAVTFSARRRGYDEDEVDAFLDTVVDSLLRSPMR
jgi:DivIVA domain-containing protein